jgi:hypothetical protein
VVNRDPRCEIPTDWEIRQKDLVLVRAFLFHDDLLKDSFGDFFKFITDVFIPSHTIPDFVATSALMVPSHLGFAEKAKKMRENTGEESTKV